ncbi:MAG: NUDIX domain-containing protein [Gammaproteobacteria bacterium]|nr:NUDIX domain-containing protein [Gammaproteobacteria bacterium]MBI5617362.1 NUDIX domain-containing protein [Gammaproteobacteria bacterium]
MTRPRLIVCVGRFQPPDRRHLACIEAALAAADEVLVVVGGADRPRAVPDPWAADERAAMLRACFPKAGAKLAIETVRDVVYDDERWAEVLRARLAQTGATDIGVMPCGRRGADVYAALFPEWRVVAPPDGDTANEGLALAIFEAGGLSPALRARVPAGLHEIIACDLATAPFQELAAEWAHIVEYRQTWSAAPFPPIFVTVDTLVTHGDAVLLIRRGRRPGLGLGALPGGFIDRGEYLFDAALRELLEETGIALPREVIAAACVANRVFDAPYRSLRGRTITHAFHFDLPPALERPSVTGGDDAADAHWVALRDIDSRELFEDHHAILQVVLGID